MSETNLDVIFTAPHPDDLEIGCGGTIAKLVSQGYRVGMVHMTTGEPTPRGTPEKRAKESAAAAEVLGVAVCETLGLTNRELMDTPASRYAVATMLRKYRPKVLVGLAGRTPSASPDHYQAQLITEASRFYSQLTKWDDRFDGTQPHRMDHLVYRPTLMSAEAHQYQTQFVVDITETMDKKLAAISCYESQFDGRRLKRIQHFIRSTAGYEGGQAGYMYGELYAIPRVLGTSDMIGMLGDWKIPPPWKKSQDKESIAQNQ